MNTSSTYFPALEIRAVSKNFKKLQAVKEVSFSVPQGCFLGLLGPNGAGKTTLVEMIEGLQFPTSGEIYVFGKNWQEHPKEIRNLMGLSLQETHFPDKWNVGETIHLYAKFFGESHLRVDEVLEMIQLKEKTHSRIVHLSGGQKQRLALGLALINKPKILLLDEPTTGLDPVSRRQLWELLKQIRREYQLTLILTTHYMEEAEELCDDIVIMDQGQLIARGTVRELLAKIQGVEKLNFTLKEPTSIPFPDEGYLQSVEGPNHLNEYQLTVKSMQAYLPILLNFFQNENLQITHLTSKENNLEDVFMALTGKSLHD